MLGLVLCWSFSHIQIGWGQDEAPAKEPSGAEKAKKALDSTLVIDYTGNSIQEALNHLKTKTGVNFVLDVQAVNFPVEDAFGPMGGGGGGMQIHLKSDRGGKVRSTLQRMLTPYHLTYVIVDDSVLVTSEELGLYRQMRQRVSLDVKEQPLKDSLKDLARTTGLNMVLDPRVAKQAQSPVSLQLDDATLETAVKLLAEIGNLKAVRMGNVLFVTSEERAEKIRREERQIPSSPLRPDGMVFPGGFGGGMGNFVAPPGIGVGMPPPPMVDPAMPGVVPAPMEDVERRWKP